MRKRVYVAAALVMVISLVFSGCEVVQGIFNKVPEEYTEGIDYDRDFPDDIFEIYDDAVVYDEDSSRGAITLTFGTEDDLDDVIDFYRDFFKDNEIILLEEEEDKDEYYARGVFEGYEFEIAVEEADGEYIEDLFENVIEFTTEELDEDETALQATAAATDAPVTATPAPAATEEAVQTAEPTAAPTQTLNGETPLTSLSDGAWTMYYMFDSSSVANADCTIQIYDDSTGTFYYYDYDYDEMDAFDFSYTISGGNFVMDDGTDTYTYEAYLDDGTLHLIRSDIGIEMYLMNWNDYYGVYYSADEFTAYGDWIYYNPETGYLDTISFWPDNTGYVYNWSGDYSNYYMSWEYSDGIITIYDEMGNTFTYYLSHYGEMFELQDSDGYYYPYFRINERYWLSGTYYLLYTTDEGLEDWYFTLYSDYSMEYTINGTTQTSYWYLDYYTGKIVMYLYDTYFEFDYHNYISGLILWDADNYLYYEFGPVG